MEYISISRIKTYLNCPMKYKLSYIDKVPKPFKPVGLAFGRVIHSTAEWLNRKLGEGEKPEFERVWRIFKSDWFALSQDNINFGNSEGEDALIEKARKMLGLLYNRQTNGVIIREVEMPFQVELVDEQTGEILPVPLRGVFDWVENDDTLAEMKTSARKFDTEVSTNRLQLAAYDYAYRKMFGKNPKIEVVDLVKTKEPKLLEMEVALDKSDTQNLLGSARLFLTGVENGIFYPNKSFMCKNCEYRDICGIPVE